MSAAETAGGLTEASRHALLPPQPVALGADPLAEIAANCSPATFLWAAALLDRLEPVDQRTLRNEALRGLAKLVKADSISRTAKDLEGYVRRYIADMWPIDRDNGGPIGRSSQLRLALWRFVQANHGRGLSWRQILTIIEG